MYWRHEDLVRRAMGELFATFPIILLGKREVNLVRGRDKSKITSGCIIAGVAEEELNVAKAKRRGITVSGGLDMLAGAQQKEEANDAAVTPRMEQGVRSSVGILNRRSNKRMGMGLTRSEGGS
jgi:hypothetical protein